MSDRRATKAACVNVAGVGERRPSNLGSVDRTLEVRTPESIAFNYELAGLGSRFLALIVDQAIQILTLVAIFGGIFWRRRA